MKKKYLMTPGPTPVPPWVRLAIARPVIHHRSDEFHLIHQSVTDGLKRLFKTKGDVFIFGSSGTGAMEAAVVNTLSPGEQAIVVMGGKFAERWGAICELHGATVVPIDLEWGRAVNPDAVGRAIAGHPEAKAVFVSLCETSTTVKNDIRAIAGIVRKSGAILVVDAISGLAVSDFRMDQWGVDVAIAAGQKGFMIPTGLSFAAVGSARAWTLIERSRMPKYYFDWKAAKRAAGRNETAWSAPVSLVGGLKESLEMIMEEGIDNAVARHARLGKACRAAVTALGLRLLAPDDPADGVTGIWAPEGVSGSELRDTLREKYGVTVAGGQEKLKGRVIRIAHMGYADAFDVITAAAALEMALNELGHPVPLGRAVAAAEKVLTT